MNTRTALHLVQSLRRRLPGLALCLALALVSISLGSLPWFAAHGLSALTVAIALGIVVGNTVYRPWAARLGPGVSDARQTLLRAGVVLYGLRLTLQDIGQVGLAGVLTDAAVLTSTFGLAWLLGTRYLRLDRTSALLIGAGSAICGAAAVLATEPVLRARAEKVSVAVSTVVVFGTVSIFLYPLLYAMNLRWNLLPAGPDAFGIYIGSTVHEVAQVLASARSIGERTADVAVVAKMVRVMMLAPFLIGLSAWIAREDRARRTDREPSAQTPALAIPWFALLFVGVVVAHTLVRLPNWALHVALDSDALLLAMAMAALGLTTHLASVRQAGIRPLLLAALLFVWLVAGGAAINRGFHQLAASLPG